MTRSAWAALLVAIPAIAAGGLQNERLEVEQRLATERLALSALRNKETSVLGVLDLLQRMRRDAETRERVAKEQERVLKRQLQAADERERWTRAIHEALAARLAPASRRCTGSPAATGWMCSFRRRTSPR